MVYTYNEKHKELRLVETPRLKGSVAERVKKAKAPKAFLKTVMDTKLKIERA